MSNPTLTARDDLAAFRRDLRVNFFTADKHLQQTLRHYAGERRYARTEPRLTSFGEISAGALDACVVAADRFENLPRLERFGPDGERIEMIRHHPAHHEAGELIYGSGLLGCLREPGDNLTSTGLFFLSSLHGEAGHNCPVVCTAGAIKAFRSLASPDLRARYLERMLSDDYEMLANAAQFMTEIQGGWDVGANSLRAEKTAQPGVYRLHGEKWFCSNAAAHLALVTARVGDALGTRGLGLFVVPRVLDDGTLNGYCLRRLKDKLGTRALATAEIEFQGATAYALGEIRDGFKNMMTFVINTSRLFNAVGTAAVARRSYYVADAYAHRRRAFGPPIASFPMVQETLANLRAESAAAISGVFSVVAALDELERGMGSETTSGFVRMGLSLAKAQSARTGSELAYQALGVLGGNGAIEDFSVLPRLLRDSVVFDNWEGTTNVLFMQLLRDCQKEGCHEPYFERLLAMAQGHAELPSIITETRDEFRALLTADLAQATLLIRQAASRAALAHWAVALHEQNTDASLVEHFVQLRLGPRSRCDEHYLKRIQMLGEGFSGDRREGETE